MPPPLGLDNKEKNQLNTRIPDIPIPPKKLSTPKEDKRSSTTSWSAKKEFTKKATTRFPPHLT